MVIDIPDIQLELAWPACRVSPIDLCQPGDAWQHVVASHLFRRIARQVLHQKRTWPDEAHFATEHVDQLWQFIEARASKEAAEPAEALGIGEETPHRIPGIAHGAEFVDHERPAMQTGALLLENDRCADG